MNFAFPIIIVAQDSATKQILENVYITSSNYTFCKWWKWEC